MQDQRRTDKVKKQLEKISTVMQRIEKIAKEEVKTREDFLQVCGALLAVTRNMYVEALGPFDTARMFEAAANSFKIQEELIEVFRDGEKPTIH
tara:strand:+ start:644 stop:922 length:279 start_codon:yes stop_codon:yes gene_type:complete